MVTYVSLSTGRVTHRLVSAAVVGATLYVLDGSPVFAASVAAAFLALQLATDAVETFVGDYAGNALMGLLVLGITVYAAILDTSLWFLAAGALVGGWLLIDGVQHLRHGETRSTVSAPTSHEGNVVVGLLSALLDRLLAPFRL